MAADVEVIDTGVPSTVMDPVSAISAPERILISVDLPAPFSPTSASTWPTLDRQVGAADRPHSAETLRDARHFQPDLFGTGWRGGQRSTLRAGHPR